MNYLKEFFVQRLLLETNMKKLTYWNDYKHAFRTYNSNDIAVIRKIDYETNEERKDKREDQRKDAEK